MTNIQSNTEYDYNTTTIQMGFRRKSNDLFKSVSQEFTLITNMCIYYHLCRRIMVALYIYSCLATGVVVGRWGLSGEWNVKSFSFVCCQEQFDFWVKTNNYWTHVYPHQVFWFWLIVCVNIVRTFKGVTMFSSRNILILIYKIAPLKRVLHFQHLTDQYDHIRKHWLLVDSRWDCSKSSRLV